MNGMKIHVLLFEYNNVSLLKKLIRINVENVKRKKVRIKH